MLARACRGAGAVTVVAGKVLSALPLPSLVLVMLAWARAAVDVAVSDARQHA